MYSVGLAILIIGASSGAGALAAGFAGDNGNHRYHSFQATIVSTLVAAIGLALLSFPT
jgi:hypothetical protein